MRHNTKVEAVRRTDFVGWREDLKNRILKQFQMVVEAPETAHLRIVGHDEVRDEPQYLLSRAVDLFRQRREKLLDGDDPDRASQKNSVDRDKSDMAGAVPIVASLYLTEQEYTEIIVRMSESRYAHIRKAATDYPTLAKARAAVEERRAGAIDGTALSDLGGDELLARADELVTEGDPHRASRRMPILGLEYLARRLRIE